ncbi:hypothetical protein DBB36_17435 [Flavobacterium sp. WLB]|uniref:hypothetical protein n=1 Tax=unclassified Flavobacterium TaxID=196869 RepID=UPI0006AB8A82|nr:MULTISPECIES: hypothetical protein [unclassified Flavobacterium]KOP38767.1 hypothetical protein AKO67_06915 [Flavobacterium sp. VMW]OWU92702.1 hypothetical protein APR43_01180 [Flavobacterium sp. NLM]PUU68709.1 hypothetical protein DBB36_17435 [Flavobacterium sp. WLB]
MRTILIFFCFLNACLCHPQQQQHYSPKVQLAIETYAFLKAQSAALKKVAMQFPCFTKEVRSLEKNAQAVFGRAEKNIEHFLQEELNDSQFTNLEKHIDSLVKEQLKNPIQKKKYADKFLENIKDKIEFSQDAAVHKGIISFAYHDAPHQEVTDGHSVKFTIEGHPKAEETVLTLPIPKSWTAQEAEMPDTVKEFTSCDGKGNEKILILIHELPEEYQNFVLTEKSVLEMIPPQSRLIRTEPVIIDNRTGIMVEIEEILDLPTNKMKVRMLQYMLAHEQKLFCLQGSIGPVSVHQNLDLEMRKYEPLFSLVAKETQID